MGENTSGFSVLFKRGVFQCKTLIFQRSIRRVSVSIARLEQLSDDAIVSFQEQQCLEIARHAFETTDFYAEFYRSHGFSRDDLFDPEVFSELPVLTKEHLREEGAKFRSSTAEGKRFLPSSTGGSTGQPLKLYHDAAAPTAALWWTVYRWAGAGPWTDVGFIQRERRDAYQRLAETAQWWPTRRIFLDSRMMDGSSIRKFISSFERTQHFMIIGYVGAVLELAEYVSRHGIVFNGLRSVSVTAAPLSDSVRSFLETVFQVPILDQYRSAEVPWIAAQCTHGEGLHVLASHRHVGFGSSSAQSGDPVDLVITDFANRAFPLVKYAIGDQSQPISGACRCGNAFPRIKPVDGRITDILRLPDGRAITGGLTGLFNKYPHAVQQFQIVQRPDASILLRCVANSDVSIQPIESARDDLDRIVGGQVPVTFELVNHIPHDSGKSRIVKSELPKENSH